MCSGATHAGSPRKISNATWTKSRVSLPGSCWRISTGMRGVVRGRADLDKPSMRAIDAATSLGDREPDESTCRGGTAVWTWEGRRGHVTTTLTGCEHRD